MLAQLEVTWVALQGKADVTNDEGDKRAAAAAKARYDEHARTQAEIEKNKQK
jgi:hypothetical protein